MKRLLAVFAVALVVLLAVISGCVPGMKAAKPSVDPEQVPGTQGAEVPESGAQPGKLSPEELDKMLPPPPPSYKRDSPAGAPAPPASPRELNEKEEINASALEFAKGIPNVKHVKTCYSKMFGGWYLHLYVTKGKKIALQHYSWNPVSKEWDVSMAVKELPQDNLEYHLKGEVGDEQCTVLK
ncbi:MAG: hypothetical protein RDU20_06280 [Desulfomonilaceae bacterium]|nr:hypothetical protein [Desulfomonilaceae bacterium]